MFIKNIQLFYFEIEIPKSASPLCRHWSCAYICKRLLSDSGTDVVADCSKKQESIVSPMLIDRGDHPDTGPRVCDVLIQMPIAVKQLC